MLLETRMTTELEGHIKRLQNVLRVNPVDSPVYLRAATELGDLYAKAALKSVQDTAHDEAAAKVALAALVDSFSDMEPRGGWELADVTALKLTDAQIATVIEYEPDTFLDLLPQIGASVARALRAPQDVIMRLGVKMFVCAQIAAERDLLQYLRADSERREEEAREHADEDHAADQADSDNDTRWLEARGMH
jgi:hypothetical protein